MPHSFSRFLREAGSHKPDTFLRLPLDVTGGEGAGYVPVRDIWTVEATPDEMRVAQAYNDDKRWLKLGLTELDPKSLIPTQYTLLGSDIDFHRGTSKSGIVVLQVGTLYFIVDGHHRAAAAVLDDDSVILARVIQTNQ